MSTHEFNHNMLSDDHFISGEIALLACGNECRLLDNRRTPGIIRSVDLDNGFFIWEIRDFEDKGKFWEVELENVTSYQFKLNSLRLSATEIASIQKKIAVFNQTENIMMGEAKKMRTQSQINQLSFEIESWFRTSSTFLKSGLKIDFQSLSEISSLQEDLKSYMLSVGLLEIEEKTAVAQVLNPYSGDWIRATQIAMAEMGLKNYFGKSVRSKNVYSGIGSSDNRQKYILHRFAFMRCLFRLMGISVAELYRAMSTEKSWTSPKEPRFWSSWTFNYQVALDFSNLAPSSKYKNSYLVKRAIPIEQIFMTFLETKEMNSQYKEAEAIVLHEQSDAVFW